MKLLAILIAFGACALAGLRLSQRLQSRATLLGSLREDLRVLLAAVAVSRKPFSVLVAERQSLRHGAWFGEYCELRKTLSADAAWQALWRERAASYDSLNAEEQGAVREMLAAFTTCDCEAIARRGDELLGFLDGQTKAAGTEFAAKGRIYRSIGLLLGAALAVVML